MSKYVPKIHVKCLNDDELNYELKLRGQFVSTDSYERREKKMIRLLKEEESNPSGGTFTSPYEFEKDSKEIEIVYQRLIDIYDSVGAITSENAREIETLTVHLSERIRRVIDQDQTNHMKQIQERLMNIFGDIASFFANSPPSNSTPNEHNAHGGVVPKSQPPTSSGGNGNGNSNVMRPPNGDSSSSSFVVIDREELADIVNQSINRILNARFPTHTPENERHPNNNNDANRVHIANPNENQRNRNHQNRANDSPHNHRNNSFSERWLDEHVSVHSNDSNFSHNNDNFRHSSTRNQNGNRYIANKVNIFEWRFHFSGLDRSEDPKSMDVDSFIQKVNDHRQAEHMQESELMTKIQQLLRGPAADWYTHARRSIRTWSEFKQKLRGRFSNEDSIDDVWQQIYSKKQKHNEYTLRFIDQFVNLTNRLPDQLEDRVCVKYILNGIRPEIAKMARTAGIRTVEELISYVKENYGQNDRRDSRLNARFPLYSGNAMNNRSSNVKIEALSENECDDYEYVDEYGECAQDYVNECNYSDPQEIMKINSQQNSHPQANKTKQQKVKSIQSTTALYICQFCKGDHSYKNCPLPSDQRPRHCFICKSLQHIASACPKREQQSNTNENWRQPSESKPNVSAKQSNIPIEMKVESMHVENTKTEQIDETSKTPSQSILPPPVSYVQSLISFPKSDWRPHVNVLANGNHLIGLLDTGSHVTVMGQNLFEAIDWNEQLIPVDTTIVTADGTRHNALGMMLLKYELGMKAAIVPTLVLPIVMKKPIFGIDFQRIFNIGMTIYETNSIDAPNTKLEKVFDAHTLSPTQQSLLNSVIESLPTVTEDGVLNRTNVIEHTIDTGNSKPVYSKPYIFSPKLQEKIRCEIGRMISRGIIKKIHESSWLNAVVPVPKSDGTIRLCIDAKKLNVITKKNRHNPLSIDRIFARIPNSEYFTSIDLKDAFYQIPLASEDQLKTAFSIHGLGLFAYQRMPQGLVNSAATLNRLIETMFDDKTEPEIFVYVDDFIICSDTFERHIELLKIVSSKLQQAGLAIGLKKSKFCMKRLKFLGHEIDENGISIDSSRLQAIATYKKPTNKNEVQSFLGFAGWHRKFIEKYAEKTSPLVELIKKAVPFKWTAEQENAYQTIKTDLLNADILRNPNYDFPFHIDATSSAIGTSAILYQMIDKKKCVIAYMSTKLNDLQRKYHPIEKECLALIVALEKFRYYIQGSKIIVTTDQCSLTWLKNCKDPTGRIARWSLRLQAYDFESSSKHFSQYDPVSILSREIDMMSTPQIETISMDEELSINSLEMICTIDILKITETQDEWYKNTYETVKSDPSNKNFKIVDDILYHRFDQFKDPFGNEWKICVPEENRIDAIREQHDSILASHPGFVKTLNRLQNIYYWPKMAHQIKEYVSKCEICRTTKSSNVNVHSPTGGRRETNYPFRILSTDFIGPMTMSKKQNQYMFVVIDNFSKFVCLKPMRTAKAENVTKFLEEEVFLKYGVCERMICDNGVQFASKELKSLMNKYHSQLAFTPLYFPQANPCEIANKTIVNAIRSFVITKENQRDWDANIAAIACAINCHVHTSTSMSPYFTLYGHDMILNGKDYSRIVEVNEPHGDNVSEKFQAIRESIREHLFKSFQNIMKQNNKKAGTRLIDMSKDTYLKNMKLSNAGERYSKKLGAKYIPVKINEKVGDNTYIIADREGKILGKYHASLLMQR